MSRSSELLKILESEFKLSKLNSSGLKKLKELYSGDIDVIGSHSYGQLYKLDGPSKNGKRLRSRTIELFVIYSNFGQPNTLNPSSSIGDGKGFIIIDKLKELSEYDAFQIDAQFSPTPFNSAKSSQLLNMLDHAHYVIHVNQNGMIVQ